MLFGFSDRRIALSLSWLKREHQTIECLAGSAVCALRVGGAAGHKKGWFTAMEQRFFDLVKSIVYV